MKKVYLLAASLLTSLGLSAQIGNGGFETWNSGLPDSWDTQSEYIPLISQAPGATVTVGGNAITTAVEEVNTGALEGSSSAKITTFTVAGTGMTQVDGINSEILAQDIATTNQYAGVAFAYKTSLTTGDASGVFIEAWKANGTKVAQEFKAFTTNASAWTRDTVYLTYTSAPDSISITFASSFGAVISGTSISAPTVDGSVLEVDDVTFLDAPSASDFASVASNIVASDVADNGNGLDLQVKFDAASDEGTVSEYRVIAIQTGLALADWNGIPAGTYGVVTPNGSANYTFTGNTNSIYFKQSGPTQVTAAPIVNGAPMDIYVLSVAGGTATINQIAGPSNEITLGTLGLNELSKANVSVYPNPAVNTVTFAWNNDVNVTSVEIYNTLGQKVMSVNASETVNVNLDKLNSGMYIYRVMNNNEVLNTNRLEVVK